MLPGSEIEPVIGMAYAHVVNTTQAVILAKAFRKLGGRSVLMSILL